MSATEKDAKSDKIKSSILLHCIGEKGREIYNCFTVEPNDDKMKFSEILEKFHEYCNPRKNLTFLRYKFLTYRQKEGESFDDFVTQLKNLSTDCEFGELKDSLIRDAIIIGVSDNRLHEHLLSEPLLSLDNAIKYGQATEESKHHAKVLQCDSASQRSVQQVLHRPKANKSKTPLPAAQSTQYSNSCSTETIQKCKFCGGTHKRGASPAYTRKCNNCQCKGHYAKFCRKSKNIREVDCDTSDSIQTESEKDLSPEDGSTFYVGTIDTDNIDTENLSDSISAAEEEESSNTTDFVVDTISLEENLSSGQPEEVYSVNTLTNEWSVLLDTNGSDIQYKIDTGAQCNVLPKVVYNQLLNRPKLKETSVKLSASNGTEIPVSGKCLAKIKHKNTVTRVLFIIPDIKSSPILGLDKLRSKSHQESYENR